MGNQPSPDGVQGWVEDWPGISVAGAFRGARFVVVRLRAAGFRRALLRRVTFPRVPFFRAGALRFFLAAFLATLSPPLIE